MVTIVFLFCMESGISSLRVLFQTISDQAALIATHVKEAVRSSMQSSMNEFQSAIVTSVREALKEGIAQGIGKVAKIGGQGQSDKVNIKCDHHLYSNHTIHDYKNQVVIWETINLITWDLIWSSQNCKKLN